MIKKAPVSNCKSGSLLSNSICTSKWFNFKPQLQHTDVSVKQSSTSANYSLVVFPEKKVFCRDFEIF